MQENFQARMVEAFPTLKTRKATVSSRRWRQVALSLDLSAAEVAALVAEEL